MQTTVSDILRHKDQLLITIDRSATVEEAAAKMVEKNVGSLVVTHDDEPCGIFTERDYLRRVAIKQRDAAKTPVLEVMTADLICVTPTDTVDVCMATMSEKRVRHLVVVEDGDAVAVISVGDCARQTSRHAQAKVRYLEEFINSQYPG